MIVVRMKVFLLPILVDMKVIIGMTRNAVAMALTVPNQAGHCPAALVSPLKR
jgi:hypothetical protein